MEHKSSLLHHEGFDPNSMVSLRGSASRGNKEEITPPDIENDEVKKDLLFVSQNSDDPFKLHLLINKLNQVSSFTVKPRKSIFINSLLSLDVGVKAASKKGVLGRINGRKAKSSRARKKEKGYATELETSDMEEGVKLDEGFFLSNDEIVACNSQFFKRQSKESAE